MIDLVVRSFIGQLGGKVLDFYLQYSLWINALILGYFLIIIISRRNFMKVLYAMVQTILEKQENRLKGKNSKQIEQLISKVEIPWEVGLKASFFPLITPPRGLRLYLKNKKSIEKLYNRNLIADILYNTQKSSTNLKEN